ncbi:MAG: hypothetical protein M1833_006666 [Piccolia ochrophora]|nr:MAG: hypothetical protein M1833_006666 [Piccolia ochrophora]
MAKKRRADEASLDADGGEDGRPEFPHLKPRVKRVSLESVKKWEKLPSLTQERVRRMFDAVERPVMMRYRDGKRRVEAQTALASLMRRLAKGLAKLPFPQTTKDAHFDHDKLLEMNRVLEAQLTPELHSIALLEAEVKKEEGLLQADRQRLSELEKHARAEASRRKQQGKRVHPLLQAPNSFRSIEDDASAIGLVTSASTSSNAYNARSDSKMDPILHQLENHLSSIRDNTTQVKGVGAAVAGTWTALDNALYTHLDEAQYEQITTP